MVSIKSANTYMCACICTCSDVICINVMRWYTRSVNIGGKTCGCRPYINTDVMNWNIATRTE